MMKNLRRAGAVLTAAVAFGGATTAVAVAGETTHAISAGAKHGTAYDSKGDKHKSKDDQHKGGKKPHVYKKHDNHVEPYPQMPEEKPEPTPANPAPITSAAELPTTVTAVFATEQGSSAESSASDIATGKANIMVSTGVEMSKKKVRKLEKLGKCFMVGEGTKYPVFDNQGWNHSGRGYGRDTRRTEVCNENGTLRKVGCHNKVKLLKQKAQEVREKIFWMKKKATLKLTAKAPATARCETDHTAAVATAYAEASVTVRARDYLRTASQGARNAAVKLYNNTAGTAVARAYASVHCVENSAVIIQVAEQKPIVVPPKNGAMGAGESTPGKTSTGSTVGGEGAGGAPATVPTSTTAEVCRDVDNKTDGDLDETTKGDLMYGKADQIGDCVGPAVKMA